MPLAYLPARPSWRRTTAKDTISELGRRVEQDARTRLRELWPEFEPPEEVGCARGHCVDRGPWQLKHPGDLFLGGLGLAQALAVGPMIELDANACRTGAWTITAIARTDPAPERPL